MTTRALTTAELALIRGEGQSSEIYLGILTPEIIFACRVNQSFETHDQIAQVVFDSVASGVYTDILAGMSLYVGSSAGAYDLGIVRVRKAATSAIVYIGENSRIAWANNLYLTVVDEIGLWAKHPRTVDVEGVETTYMDYDVGYVDEHNALDPVPVLGSVASTLWLVSGTVDYNPDASDSWVLGSSISSYLWSATGGSVVDETTAMPTFTFASAGQYRISCQVTAANGKSFTGHRTVFVYDENNPPITDFVLTSCVGAGSGWAFSVEVFANAEIRDRSLVVLFAKDSYDGTEQSIGAQVGNENIIAVGWVSEESIRMNPEQGSVIFTAHGAATWLEKTPSFPIALINAATTPSGWSEFEGLTVDMATWHLLHWRSTATAMMDITLSDDTRIAPSLESPGTSLLEQINTIALRILASARCDRYSGLWLQIDSQYLAESDRTSIPIVLDITSQDWMDSVSITRQTVPVTSLVELSGIYYDGATKTRLDSRAAGNIFSAHGVPQLKDNLLLESQIQANLLSGLNYSRDNNEYPIVRIPLSFNERMIDIAPRQYVTMSLSASDTERGIVWVAKKIIPRRITPRFDSRGVLFTELEGEAEVLEGLSVTYERPQTPIGNFPPLPDFDTDFPIIPFPDFNTPPDYIPIDPVLVDPDCLEDTDAPTNGGWDLWLGGIQQSNDAESKLGYIPAWVRSSAYTNLTTVVINGTWQTRNTSTGEWENDSVDDSWYHVYAVDPDGVRVATATLQEYTDATERIFVFSPVVNLYINHIEVSLEMDGTETLVGTFNVYGGDPIYEESFDNETGIRGRGFAVMADNSGYSWEQVSWVFEAPASVEGFWDILYHGTIQGDGDLFKFYVFCNGVGGSNYDYSSIRYLAFDKWHFKQAVEHLYFGASTNPTIVTFSMQMRGSKAENPEFTLDASLKPSAKHRIIYSNARIFNICPRETE